MNRIKKILSVVLSVALAASCFALSASAEDSEKLRFGSDGKFKIVVFADTQDDETPQRKMIQFMGQALDREQPDLVVFTGDNVHVTTEEKFLRGATALMQPLIERDIPYAYTFGNHDAEYISKPYMHSVYQTLGRCLTYNADDSIYGYGNCNIPIYASSGSSIAFNLWIIDSNMYASEGGYDKVHQDQLDWFVRADQALEAQEGHKVDSLVFQHIVVPEVYNCLSKAGLFYSGETKKYNGTKYKLELNSNASGYLGEFPCPPDIGSDEFSTLKSRGDVIGIVTGHDHANSFVGSYNGIDFIQMPGMTFQSYGQDNARGYGVIELNESNTKTYSSYTVRYIDAYVEEPLSYSETNGDLYGYTDGTTYISEVKCAQDSSASAAQSQLTSAGFKVIDFDLNTGAAGQYIYMGYKTTQNYADAIKSLRFYSDSGDFSDNKLTFNINGVPCTFTFDKTDLNKGSGGDYVYVCYTKDSNAGPAITDISFSFSLTTNPKPCGLVLEPAVPAELNNGTTKHEKEIYCYTETNDRIIDISSLKADYNDMSAVLMEDFSDATVQAFSESLAEADTFISTLESARATNRSDAYIETLKNNMADACALLTSCLTENGFIYGFEKPTLPNELDGKFNSSYADVTYQPTSKYMGTGSRVNLAYGGRQACYTAVVFGDVNGDAWYDGEDAAIVGCIVNGMLSESDVGAAAYMAADCNHDGVIDKFDVDILKEAGVLLAEVDQTKSGEELLETSSAYVEYLNLIDQTVAAETEEDAEDEPIDPEFTFCFFDKLVSFFKTVFSYIVKAIDFIKAL